MFNDELLRAAREFQKMQNNPAHQAAMEHQRRIAGDPAYRAKIEAVNRLQNDPAHQALLKFTENRHLYQQIINAPPPISLDERTRRELGDLRNSLAHHNAELWLKSDALRSSLDLLQEFDRLRFRAADLIPIYPVTDNESEDGRRGSEPLRQNAVRIIEDLHENRTAAEEELAAGERLVIFVKLGKKEYRVKDLAVEENTNKVAAFLDDEDNDGAFVYCSPFRIEYRFYKESISD